MMNLNYENIQFSARQKGLVLNVIGMIETETFEIDFIYDEKSDEYILIHLDGDISVKYLRFMRNKLNKGIKKGIYNLRGEALYERLY